MGWSSGLHIKFQSMGISYTLGLIDELFKWLINIQNAEFTKSSGATNTLYKETHGNTIQMSLDIFLKSF